MNLSPVRLALVLIPLALACLALLPQVRAVSPPLDGCYPNYTTAEGCNALFSLTIGAGNTALGWRSLFLDSTGSFNTGVGGGALALNNADSNTAVGAAALLLNTTGTLNTAVGTDALVFNDSGSQNTANGAFALFSNTIGDVNTAIGVDALFSNTTGSGNTAIGFFTLYFNTTGFFNTAVGESALRNNTGDANTAIGLSALIENTTGVGNTAVGDSALDGNTTGSANTALGADAGVGVSTANGVICIGTEGADVDNSCFIGHIRDVQTANADAIPVLIDSVGQLGTASSSRRFKKEIKAMDEASEAILALKPVTFHYKSDTKDTPQFGLIAEDVAKVNPDLVVRDKNGEIYTVRYEAVNAMLLSEFLKEHRKVEQMQKQIEALTAGLQKVSAQLEASKPAPQVVNNP